MQSDQSPPIIEYGHSSHAKRWRTHAAVTVAAPLGIAAGWATYEAGFGAIVALALCSIVCSLCVGLIAVRYRIAIGCLMCASLAATIVFRSMQYDAQIKRPFESGRYLVQFVIVFVIAAVLSLLVTVPLTVGKRRAA